MKDNFEKKMEILLETSPALSRRILNDPALKEQLRKSPYLKDRKTRDIIDAELSALLSGAVSSDVDSFKRAIRVYKYGELARLVLKDICGTAPVREILLEWSDVTDSIINFAYDFSFNALIARHGKLECTGSIIALGKLGGRELNISSDIDIMLIYDSDDGGAEKNGKTITNHEFFVKLATDITRILSEVTVEGFAFRVDHELRPEGTQGPLANSLDAAIRYYEYFGRDWERQAHIRSRAVAGSIELGNKFISSIAPFVFRRSLALSDLAHMREMKRAMEAKAARSSAFIDVKHGPGGIREIEFLVQALQSLHGGQRPAVRKQNTFEAIDELAKAGLLHPYGAGLLEKSYSYLRRVENMIQAREDLQSHRIVPGEKSAGEISSMMGGGIDAVTETQRVMSSIERLFEAMFEADYERIELEEAVLDNLSRAADEEEEADSIAWFVKGELKRVAALDLERRLDFQKILERITLIAEVTLSCAYKMARKRLVERYGEPKMQDSSDASMAVVGMGRLGSREMDYGSDIDLCFIYSGDGVTCGKRSITNAEFFTKLSQRLISLVSMSTRYGRAYAVDSELRPSGNSGALITSSSAFEEYHRSSSQIWEKMSLLRARVVAGDETFSKSTRALLQRIAYDSAPPDPKAAKDEISKLRERSFAERSRGREGIFDLKLGRGGTAEIEAVVQYHQMLNAHRVFSLKVQNTFDAIAALGAENILSEKTRDELLLALTLLRRVVSLVRLFSHTPVDTLDPTASYFDQLSKEMKSLGVDDVQKNIGEALTKASHIYTATFGE